MWGGIVRCGLQDKFNKSSESNVLIHKSPNVKVTALQAFKKGQMIIVAMTSSINITAVEDVKESRGNAMVLTQCFEYDGKSYVAVANKRICYPTETQRSGVVSKVQVPYLAAYWHCEDSFDENKANAERSTVEYRYKAGSTDVTLKVPCIVNTRSIEMGEAIVVKKIGVDSACPLAKRQKLEAPTDGVKGSPTDGVKGSKGNASGNVKGKGKGKKGAK